MKLSTLSATTLTAPSAATDRAQSGEERAAVPIGLNVVQPGERLAVGERAGEHFVFGRELGDPGRLGAIGEVQPRDWCKCAGPANIRPAASTDTAPAPAT